LKSSRKKYGVSGEIQLSLQLVDGANETAINADISAKWLAWQGAFLQAPSPISGDDDPLSRDLGNNHGLSDDDEDESPSPEEYASAADKASKKGKNKENKRKMDRGHYQLSSVSDVVGVIFLEISSITDLPPERNGMPSIVIVGPQKHNS
jgi:phosphatidylserine decarboxylase